VKRKAEIDAADHQGKRSHIKASSSKPTKQDNWSDNDSQDEDASDDDMHESRVSKQEHVKPESSAHVRFIHDLR
jgi:hypothetical protein